MRSIRRKSKIVATIGPAIKNYEMLRDLLAAGVDVVRLNFSHGSHEEHSVYIKWVRDAAAELHNEVAILGDLQGPKIRTTAFKEPLILSKGQRLFLIGATDRNLESLGTREQPIGITYPRLAQDLKVGEGILIEDGLTKLEVRAIDKSSKMLECEVIFGDTINSHKGVNFPQAKLSAAAVTEKDWEDILFAIESGVDFIALSFVRTAQEIRYLKQFLESKNSNIHVVAKIEKPEAIENIEEIVKASDAIMVARGDLGVEVGNEKVPLLQKKIIRLSRKYAKPVITATQMLMSMIHQPTPSRAEASDIANAVFDGTDALMLSNETASGAYPVKAVEVMDQLILGAELHENEISCVETNSMSLGESSSPLEAAAAVLAMKMGASAIACLTRSGVTARNLSQLHPTTPIFAFVENERIRRQLSLTKGVFVIPWTEVQKQDYTVFDDMMQELWRLAFVKKSELAVFVAGIPTSQKRGTSNTIAVRRLGAETWNS